LLKNTYRIDRDSNPELYTAVDTAKDALGLSLDVTVYQSEDSGYSNASIVTINKEAHIVLSGQVLKLLSADELLAVVSHELSHALLWVKDDEEFNTTSRIITAIANDYSNDNSYLETARLFNLYTEIFADMGALYVCKKIDPVITGLVKMITGLENVSANSYIKQAEEIISKTKNEKSEGESHPENYIRALSTKWLHENPKEAQLKIEELIQGELSLDGLDVFQKQEITDSTHYLIQKLLAPGWFQTDFTLGLAKDYFKGFKITKDHKDKDKIEGFFANYNNELQTYFSYLLLDFSLVDKDLEETPIAWMYQVGQELGLVKSLDKIVMKELSLSERKLSSLKKSSASSLAKVSDDSTEVDLL